MVRASFTLRPTLVSALLRETNGPFHYGDLAVRWKARALMLSWVMAACVPLYLGGAATSMKLAGKVSVPVARLMVTTLSAEGRLWSSGLSATILLQLPTGLCCSL